MRHSEECGEEGMTNEKAEIKAQLRELFDKLVPRSKYRLRGELADVKAERLFAVRQSMLHTVVSGVQCPILVQAIVPTPQLPAADVLYPDLGLDTGVVDVDTLVAQRAVIRTASSLAPAGNVMHGYTVVALGGGQYRQMAIGTPVKIVYQVSHSGGEREEERWWISD
jgi:hypothetical protein